MKKDTLVFSIISYSLIAASAFLYGHLRVGLGILLALTPARHQPLSNFEFSLASIILMFGIGASICLVFLLGVVANRTGLKDSPTIFGVIERIMQVQDRQKETLGGLIFSDVTRRPKGMAEALLLQAASLVHAVFKILMVYLCVGLLNRGLVLVLGALYFLPPLIWRQSVPLVWDTGIFLVWFYACYRAELFWLAKRKGLPGIDRGVVNAPINLSIRAAVPPRVTPRFIAEILTEVSVIQAIKMDLGRTGQIGYKEVWRLGLITPDQDKFDPTLSRLPRQERTKRFLEDSNARLNFAEQIPLRRTAVLHGATYFNIHFDNLVITGGAIKPCIGFYPGWSYSLGTKLNPDESISLRHMQIETDSLSARNRSRFLPQFLQEDGFPLKASYVEGDPLTTDRGGTIVIDKGKVTIIYPRYFVQRRLMDDEGNLIDLGIDESFFPGAGVEVKMRPSVSERLHQYVSANGYACVLRYRSVPYASDFMFPILDTPMSLNGWTDLYIDTRGKGKLFIAREKTVAEWYEMLERLRQLLFSELARKDYHLLGLTKDRAQLHSYLLQKQQILKDYFIIQHMQLF